MNLKVLTLNVHGWETPDGQPNVDLVSALLAASGADLIALNEVWHPSPDSLPATGEESRPGSAAPLARLAADLGCIYIFGYIAAARLPSGARIPYGNALLSRLPIQAYALHHLPAGTRNVPRGLIEARLALPAAAVLTVYVTHLDHRSEPARLAQWAAARAWLNREAGRPHLLLGDLNALAASDYPTPEAEEALQQQHAERGWVPPSFDLTTQVLAAGYVDAYARRGRGPGHTWPAAAPERRVDYVFLSQEASGALVGCRSLEEPALVAASDHLAVLAELEWPG